MLKLEDLQPDIVVSGLLANCNVTILHVQLQPNANSAIVTYEYDDPNGHQFARSVIHRSQEADLDQIIGKTAFCADPNDFKLAVEAKRIQWAYLFDPMMAVNSSVVTPLPHQITAVYESMLPKQPLRFLLADDPGAGKTIMAGLLIKELSMRADAQRILIVAPGSLTGQWQDELREKFGLEFEIFSKDKLNQSGSGNPFKESGCWIIRLDQFSRTEPTNYQPLIEDIDWDLVIMDEAHKVAAHYAGTKVNKTQRFRFAELLSAHTRHFLLMTATPHNGKEEDFQLFLSLLDSDRFYGKPTSKLEDSSLRDIMRRMVKEDMRKFDGTRLFPDRVAHTVPYSLSQVEAALYQAVTNYVRTEMNRAEKTLNESKKNVVGFALTLLQRRLASSPEAIYKSLLRRRERLEIMLTEWQQHPEKIDIFNQQWGDKSVHVNYLSDSDDLTSEETESLEENASQNATAAKTLIELQAEIIILQELERQAKAVCLSDCDSKWSSLSELLQGKSPDGSPLMNNKLIIFTEHKDTLEYLKRKITGLYGNTNAVVTIHGGVNRDDRKKIQEAFRNDPVVRFLVATDAAGEGINLQNTNYMINYDLPWNPNRIEQRFGRIHRIGQQEVCHLWNLVATDTREGEVFNRLLLKLRQQKDDLGDRVFDVLGELFAEGSSLKDVLLESIRDDGEKKREFLMNKIDMAFERQHIENVLKQNALCQSDFDGDKLFNIKKRMDEAEARRLQPCYVEAFFQNAFKFLNGQIMPKETGRLQIKRVPPNLLNYRATTRGGLPIRQFVAPAYERVCFDKDSIELLNTNRHYPRAEFLHPGHPLMQAIIANTLEKSKDAVAIGTILVDDRDDLSESPRLLSLVELGAKESLGQGRFAGRQMLFLSVSENGEITDAGPAPHLDLRAMSAEESTLISPFLNQLSGLSVFKDSILAEANNRNKRFYDELMETRHQRIAHERQQIEERLNVAIMTCDDKLSRLRSRADTDPKKTDAANIQKLKNQMQELKHRLQHRTEQLRSEEKLLSMPPIIFGSALVIPKGYFLKLQGRSVPQVDVLARKRVERIAMDAVIAAEEALGYSVFDCSRENKGWDIESTVPSTGEIRHIEIKGITERGDGNEQITVSRNEWLQGHNLKDKFILAYVLVNSISHSEPKYVRNPFSNQPDAMDTQKSINVKQLSTIAKSAGEV